MADFLLDGKGYRQVPAYGSLGNGSNLDRVLHSRTSLLPGKFTCSEGQTLQYVGATPAPVVLPLRLPS